MNKPIEIRKAQCEEDGLIADHFYQMWLDNEVTPDSFASDWRDQILQFIDVARRSLDYQAFVAVAGDQVIGSVGCQRFAGLYPIVFKPSYRCDGYIWGVYVGPPYRHQGIGRQLTKQSILYLRSIGCTHAVLNASPSGKALYEHIGFITSNLMRLSLLELDKCSL
ncbi:GNAT family N-acetyltransferase [Leptolyngbya sp. AN03gr2]|uniref:GNAT family N-acetyltransferase n=1 Tax=unclassified Leptolyngbya TaxID=2650499 RepID=UPI003D31843F